MTTLIPKFEQTGSTVNRAINLKLQENYNVQDFGAVPGSSGNPATNAIAIQAAVDSAISNGVGLTFNGSDNYHISTAITISGPISIFSENNIGLLCVGCNGLVIAAGVNSVKIDGLYLGQVTRYTTTPNVFSAITIDGVTASRNFWHSYSNLFIDGFKYGINASYVWASSFFALTIVYGDVGINVVGLSVNNMVSSCQISSNVTSAITIGDGTSAVEGWLIQDNLLFGSLNGVLIVGCSNSNITNNIIDGIGQNGIILLSGADIASTNWTITDNYIAGDAMSNGIRCKNDYAPAVAQYRGNFISGNQILGYTSLAYGITIDGVYERNNIIIGNRIKNNNGASGYDCFNSTGITSIVSNNIFEGRGFYTGVLVTYSNNIGAVLSAVGLLTQTNGANSVYYTSASPPSTGTYNVGDISWNQAPAAGGTPGWVCTTAGTPGTWKAMANLAA